MRKSGLKKVKGLTVVQKNIILCFWRASVGPEFFGGSKGSQVQGARSEVLLAQPCRNSLLWNGHPGTKGVANSIGGEVDGLTGLYHFPFRPCLAVSQVHAVAQVLTLLGMFLQLQPSSPFKSKLKDTAYICPTPVLTGRINHLSISLHSTLLRIPLKLCRFTCPWI